ncbi:DNA-primase RepB domain-containing protein [Streptomyces sp. 5-10]|uniref:DNA-primase RepB domain-containing protein n=1 Tax=Streptomyces sp. 5-10 TaxID=878925 RepID=UPI00168AA26F|nr:DNA-primase RepB domain-containing protein [Streptomyces sp. 5-10]MBD3004883.1 DUF3987 domain-containing protein [Streptomyces sp. 5-10]
MSFEFFDPSFFDTLFPGEASDGRDLGYAVLALYPGGRFDPDPKKGPTQLRFFSWPSQREDLIAFCLHNTDLDIYTTPALFKKRGSREASNISHQWAAYADADSLDLRKVRAEPTMIVETSPGRHHLYWVTTVNNTKQLTEISRAIAYAHAADGCDKSGWDAGQLLRVPGTANNKPDVIARHGDPFEVRLKREPGQPFSGLSRLKELYPAYVAPTPSPASAGTGTGMPDPGEWRRDPKVLEEVSRIFHYAPDIHSMYVNPVPHGKRSDTLWRLLSTLSRHGASRLAAMHIAWGARCNKFAEDGRLPDELWRTLCKAFDDPSNQPVTTSVEVAERTRLDASEENPENRFRNFVSSISILRDDERPEVPSDTFVDHYTAWASTRTDAPAVYHRAGAVTLLTSVFGEFGSCPTKFDSNLTLWFLLLGPTTRARKTTAMMLWVDLLADLQNERFTYRPMSDVTSEGLSEILPKRDGKTTVFYRDEAHGLLYELDAKRYLKGLQEHMTELYGGRVRMRVRATTGAADEDDAPVGNVRTNFVMFLCGTLDQVTDALTIDDYQSGHLTRFLTAEANPPEQTEEEMYFEQFDGAEEAEDAHRLALMSELSQAREFWMRNTRPGKTRRVPFTDDAWRRLHKAMFQIKQISREGSVAEALKPTAHRMGISVMKCAVLLAMSEHKLRVEMRHILKAISLAEEWLASTATIAGRIMHSSQSARQEEILTMIRSRMDGVTQQEIYSRFRMKMHEKEIESALSVLLKADLIRKTNDLKRVRYVRTPRT